MVLSINDACESLHEESDKIFHDMKRLSSKQMNRIEKKKKKMAALVEIAKLNELDRSNKPLTNKPDVDNTEPSPKRLRTEPEQTEIKIVGGCVDAENIGDGDLGASGKPKLSGEDFVKLKSLLRENTKAFRNQPKFWLREMGDYASLSTEIENRVPLFLSDVQHLIMYSQVGHHSPYSPARWCQLEKYTKVLHTCVFIVENLSLVDYISNETLFPFTGSTFDKKLELLNPGAYKGDIVRDLVMVPLTSTQVRKFTNQYGTVETAVVESNEVFDIVKNLFPLNNEDDSSKIGLPQSDKFPRTQLLLSGWQMVEENFPLPIKGLMEHKYAGYVLTKDEYKAVSSNSPMFGLDCEMCKTTIGDLELTRVSIVDETGNVFYEQLVKPDNKITDYLTKYSGITAKIMKTATKRLADVQNDIRNILPSDAILVGQSLSNDMHALKMMHPYIIDSSVIFNITGNRTRKTKLQTLAREFLNERIQQSNSGHCPIEDSLASLKLVQLKLTKSLYFGDAVMSNVQMQIRQQPELGHPNYATSMLKQVTKMEKSALVVGLPGTSSKYQYYTFKDSMDRNEKKIACVSKKSNKSVVKKLCESSAQYSLSIAHVKVANVGEDKEQKLRDVDDWIKEIYEHTGKPSLHIVIFGGQKDFENGCCFIKLKTS